MVEKFLNLKKEMHIQAQEEQSPKQGEPWITPRHQN